MKRKGFTLIELLAVIVILAIIALITTPMILGVIDSVKKGAAENSTYGYIDAIEKSDLKNMIDTENDTLRTDGTYNLSTLTNVSYKGKSPSAVCIVIKSGIVESGSFQFEQYIIDYANGKAKVNRNKTEVSCEPTVEKEVANAPVLSEGMIPIKWDINNNEIATTADDPEWYDYVNKLWANVKTVDGSYWVWIPRYAYKITSQYHSNTAGSINVKFLKETSDTTADETTIETSGYVARTKDTSMHYFTHPAFQNGINQKGFWVAKFEPTAVEGIKNSYMVDNSCPIVGDNVPTKTIKIVPNVSSWRCVTIANAYKASIFMKNRKDDRDNSYYGWKSNEVDTHMATNLEWGAIYYLTLSTYGTSPGEVYINNSQTYTTGCAGSTASQTAYNGCQNTYDTVIGVKASTTQNITGIYDLVGGSWERTMSSYNNLLANSDFTTTEYNALPNVHITKYITSTSNLLNNSGMDYDSTIYGDGIYETSAGVNRYNGTIWSGSDRGGWNVERSYLPHVSSPWFTRGAPFTDTIVAGVGSFGQTHGAAGSSSSFRPIVSVIK